MKRNEKEGKGREDMVKMTLLITRWLFVQMKRLLPENSEILEEFKHPLLKWSM
jgi:hypothetical protein